MYTNVKQVLDAATQYPAAVEAMLPEGAPKISTMLLDAATKIPVVPDFPMEIPDMPAPPVLPAFPATPALARTRTRVETRPLTPTPIPQVLGVTTAIMERRGI